MKLSKYSILYKSLKVSGTIFGFGFFAAGGFNPVAALVVVFLSIASFLGSLFWFYLVWDNFDYEISDSVDIKSGVFRKKVREIPLRRIQNVDVSRNIFHRILGIAKVSLETAGGNATEASLTFVDYEEAKRIKDVIKSRESEKEDETEDKVIYSMEFKDLALLSIFSLDLRLVSIVLLILPSLGLSELFLQGFNVAIWIFVSGLLVLVISSMLSLSFASNLAKYYGFTLYKSDERLMFERGLFNRVEGSIPLDKIQSLIVEEKILMRFFGFASLKVETAGYSMETQFEKGSEVAIPLASRDEVDRLSGTIFGVGDYSIQSISRNAVRRYFARYALVSLLPVFVLILAFIDRGVSPLFSIVFIPLLAVAAYLKYVYKGFDEGEEYVFVRNGFWSRRTFIVPYYRLQNLMLTQSIFQNRLGVSNIILDTAGFHLFSSGTTIFDLDDDIAEELFDKLYYSFKQSKRS